MSQTRSTQRGPHQIKMVKIKNKKRFLKAVREKQLVMYKGMPIRLWADFIAESLQARRVYTQSKKRKTHITKNTLHSKER